MIWLLAPAMAAELLLESQFTAADPDYLRVPFEVPVGTAEIGVTFAATNDGDVLDFGLEGPDGWRGWSGGHDPEAATGADAASRSYTPGPMAGTWQLVVGRAKAADDAPFTATIDLRETATLPPDSTATDYEPSAALATGRRYYKGDVHVHSEASGDADASLDTIAELAASRGLDFVVVTDHNTAAGHQRIVAAQARHPSVLLIPGLEVTTYEGHVGALGVSGPLVHTIGTQGREMADLLDEIDARDGIAVLNHADLTTELCIGCAWTSDADTRSVGAIEVVTGSWAKVGRFTTPAVIERWERMADAGQLLAPVGGSDDHNGGVDLSPIESPIGTPTTLVLADELSASAILAGIASGHTALLTEDPRGPSLTLVDPTTLAPGEPVTLTATDADGMRVRWFVDGASARTTTVTGSPATLTLRAAPGQRVRAELHDGDALMALTAFSEATSAPEAQTGCGSGRSLLWLAPLSLLWRRRRA